MPELTEQQKQAFAQLEALKKTFISTFTTTSGKRVLESLEERYFVHRTTKTKTSLDMAIREGQRSVVLWIKQMLVLNVDKLIEAVKQQEGE